MIKSSCNLTIDVKVISESAKMIKDFGMEKIYEILGLYTRISGKTDTFIINYSDGSPVKPEQGDILRISGELRNIFVESNDGDYHYPKVYIMAKSIEKLSEEPEVYKNEINFENVELLKEPEIRKAFNNDNVDIADIKIKVRRNAENIFRCTCWNNNARLIRDVQKETILNVSGRLQSKKLKNDGIKTEISVNSISIVNQKSIETIAES